MAESSFAAVVAPSGTEKVKWPYLYFWSQSTPEATESIIRQGDTGLWAGGSWTVGLDVEGCIVRASEEFCSLLGYECDDVLGKKIERFTAGGTLDVQKHLGAILHFNFFEGLWLLVGRDRNPIVVRFSAVATPDLSIELRFEIPGRAPEGAG